MTCRVPGIIAVGSLFVLWRIGLAMAEAGEELTTHATMGNLAICLMAVAYGGVGLFLDWKHHAATGQKPPDLAPESRNGRVGTTEARSPPPSD